MTGRVTGRSGKLDRVRSGTFERMTACVCVFKMRIETFFMTVAGM